MTAWRSSIRTTATIPGGSSVASQYLQEHPHVDLVCTRLRLIDEKGATLPADAASARWFSAAWSFRAARDDQSALDLPEWLGLANFPGTTSNFFARTSYLRDHPLAASYRHTHDYYALVLAALENRLGVIDAELLDYRIHDSDEGAASPDEIVRETLRLNVDLARQLAPRLARRAGDAPGLRALPAFGLEQRERVSRRPVQPPAGRGLRPAASPNG